MIDGSIVNSYRYARFEPGCVDIAKTFHVRKHKKALGLVVELPDFVALCMRITFPLKFRLYSW
jgi:hypothetical protein